MTARVTAKFAVGTGHLEGDYAYLHGNGGNGDIDWDNPLNNQLYDLFPLRGGLYGFGHAPFGHHPFGHGFSSQVAGFGHLPFGHYPFGHGTALVEATDEVDDCGHYKYGFSCYDRAGNLHVGDPQVAELHIHIAPPDPLYGLKKISFAAGILTLGVTAPD